MGYWTDRLNKKRAMESQERRVGYAQGAREDAIKEIEHWRTEAQEAKRLGQYAYAIECWDKVEAMKDARAGAVHEILQRRKAMGF